jgi:hypothetical protein
VTARGLAKAAEILAGQFTLVATNVPYLGRGKQTPALADYCESSYPDSKVDLATCFFERCLEFCKDSSTSALVVPQNWMFQTKFRSFREALLDRAQFNALVQVGENGFDSAAAAGAFVALVIASNATASEMDCFSAFSVADAATPAAKSQQLSKTRINATIQCLQKINPASQIVLTGQRDTETPLLSEIATSSHGLGTFDSERFGQQFIERPHISNGWIPLQSAPTAGRLFSGCDMILRWQEGCGDLRDLMSLKESEGYSSGKWKAGTGVWGKVGVSVSLMRKMPASVYLGVAFDPNAAAIVPEDPDDVVALLAFAASGALHDEVRKVHGAIYVPPHTFLHVPFDLAHWQKVAAEKYPEGLPKPFSSDPTQWLFNGHPAGADQPLHVAVARLLGYQWPRQTGSSFPDCPALGPDGLETLADDDGIVCLTPLRGEAKAAERLRKLLDAAFADAGWNERQLLSDAGSKATNLEDWLRDEFFEQHTKLFDHRPFLWHIWDGRPDGFHALVNYHQLAAPHGAGHKLLETLTYAYLGDWIRRQQDDANNNVPGAEDRHTAATILQQELKHILAGEPPYDLFIRWKPLHQQPIGWHPDLNDGIRLNIRPFLYAKDVRKKAAGILRWKPNVKWTKDRGTEPQRPKSDFPWFWTWDEKTEDFKGSAKPDGCRWNDLHYTNEAKQAARTRKEQEP